MKIDKISQLTPPEHVLCKFDLQKLYKENVDSDISDYSLELMKESDLKRTIAITVFFKIYNGKTNKTRYISLVCAWLQCSFFSVKLWVKEKPRLFNKINQTKV